MNDSVIVYEGLENAALTASGGSAVGFSLDNLKDRRYSTKWKSGSNAANQTLRATQPKAVDSILIVNHNFGQLGLTGLEIYNDVVGLITTVAPTFDPFLITFNEDLTSWIEFKFIKGSALTNPPEAGMIFIGKRASLPLYLNNPQRGLESNVIHDESLSGLPFRAATHAPRQIWKIDWGALKQQHNFEAWRWLNSVGVDLYPFWLRDMDEHWHFVGLRSSKISGSSKGNISFDLRNVELVEERVGIPIELSGGFTV